MSCLELINRQLLVSEAIDAKLRKPRRAIPPLAGMKVGLMSSGGAVRLKGFTLVELLVVIAIVALLAVASRPAFEAIQGGTNLTADAANLAGMMEQARAYAMANNTYVYVGLQEVDGVSPTSSDGTGQIAVMALASESGTRPYTDTTAPLIAGVVPITKPQALSQIHLASSASLKATDSMLRPAATDLSQTVTKTTFQWPLAGGARYKFSRVIEFDPRGSARLQTQTTFNSSIPSYIEISMVPARGNSVPTSLQNNQVAIQIEGMTGVVRVYRP